MSYQKSTAISIKQGSKRKKGKTYCFSCKTYIQRNNKEQINIRKTEVF